MESDIYYGSNLGIPKDCICEAIEEVPTIEAEPVRHGEWAEKKSGNGIFDYYFVCSECHKNTLGFLIAPDYCPHCGARMDGGISDEPIHDKK